MTFVTIDNHIFNTNEILRINIECGSDDSHVTIYFRNDTLFSFMTYKSLKDIENAFDSEN